jgi:hypothetical protein
MAVGRTLDDAEVRVAGGELRPGVADADDGAAVEDVGRERAAEPGAMDEAVFVALGEPGARSKRLAGEFGVHEFLHAV